MVKVKGGGGTPKIKKSTFQNVDYFEMRGGGQIFRSHLNDLSMSLILRDIQLGYWYDKDTIWGGGLRNPYLGDFPVKNCNTEKAPKNGEYTHLFLTTTRQFGEKSVLNSEFFEKCRPAPSDQIQTCFYLLTF